MEDRIEHLFQEWHRLGGAVMISRADPTLVPRAVEEVVAESTAYCRASARLTWVVLDWLIRHVDEIDEERLLAGAAAIGDRSVLGVLCDAALRRKRHAKFGRLMRECSPHQELTPFFHRVARSPLASRLTQENALDLFRRWNFLCAELRYLGDAPGEAVVEATSADGQGARAPVPDP